MEVAVIVCVLIAVALGVCAWKLPKVRIELTVAASFVVGVAALFVAMLTAKGDIKKARQGIASRKAIKEAVKDSKERHEQEVKDVAAIQDEVDAVSEDSPSLDALADRMNGR